MLRDHLCHVLDNRPCGHHLWVLTVRSTHPSFDCQPGQFVMVDLPTRQFFFRRPFSVLATHDAATFDLYYKVVGKGTAMMAELQPGDEVKILGPLGVGFTPPHHPAQTLLVGGGIGIAPLYFLAKTLQQTETPSPHCFYGVRSIHEVGLSTELEAVTSQNRLHFATDDGSYGFAGNVCQLLEAKKETLQEVSEAYLCGPTVMMDATYQWLNAFNPKIQVYASLEEHMPCGTGACTGCVIPRTDRFLPTKCCLEGPVFEAQTILWPSMRPQTKDPEASSSCCP